MPGALKTTAELNNIIGGTGMVNLTEGIIALAGATGLVAFTKKIGLWPKFNTVEKQEMEALDADMPAGWWARVQQTAPAAAMSGKKLRWYHKAHTAPATGWSVGTDEQGNLAVATPKLDEDTGTLV